MFKKEPRDSVLYVRIKKKNLEWIVAEMKRLRFKSRSEYMDCLIELAQEGKRRHRDRNQGQLQ